MLIGYGAYIIPLWVFVDFYSMTINCCSQETKIDAIKLAPPPSKSQILSKSGGKGKKANFHFVSKIFIFYLATCINRC